VRLLVCKLYLERVLGVLVDCRDLQAGIPESREVVRLSMLMGGLRACCCLCRKTEDCSAAQQAKGPKDIRIEGLELPTSPMPCVSCRTTLPTVSCAATLSAVPSAKPTCRAPWLPPSTRGYSRVLEGSASAQHGRTQGQRKAPAMPAAIPEGRGNQDARRTAQVQLTLRVALLRC
jgi:hypothetical protein